MFLDIETKEDPLLQLEGKARGEKETGREEKKVKEYG